MESDFQYLYHIINISTACENGLWYDFKNFRLMSQGTFSHLLKIGEITSYIDDPNHPIIGDVGDYAKLCDILKPQIQKLRKCTKTFDSLFTEIDSFSNLFSEEKDSLAKVCFSSDTLIFLAMISVDKHFKSKISDEKLWTQIWEMRFQKPSWEPFQGNVMMTYLKLRSQQKFKSVHEFSQKDPTLQQLETLSRKFELIEGDEIVVSFVNEESEEKTKKFRIARGKILENGKRQDTLLRGLVDNSYFKV